MLRAHPTLHLPVRATTPWALASAASCCRLAFDTALESGLYAKQRSRQCDCQRAFLFPPVSFHHIRKHTHTHTHTHTYIPARDMRRPVSLRCDRVTPMQRSKNPLKRDVCTHTHIHTHIHTHTHTHTHTCTHKGYTAAKNPSKTTSIGKMPSTMPTGRNERRGGLGSTQSSALPPTKNKHIAQQHPSAKE